MGKNMDYKKAKTLIMSIKSEADYMPNITLVRRDFDLIFGIGFLLNNDVEKTADQHPESNFVIVDSVVEKDNVASICLKNMKLLS